MASKIDLSALTINAEEAKTLQDAVKRLMFETSNFNQFFSTFTGFDKKTQLLLSDELGLTGLHDSGASRPNSGNLKGTLAEKFVQVILIGDTLIHTQADVDQNFKPVVRKAATDFKELNMTSEIALYLMDVVYQAVQEARWRLAFLGDTDAALQSANGYVKTGTAITLFNSVDGVWKQAFAGVTAGSTPRTTISENYAISKASQLALGTTAGLDALKGMYDNASVILKGKSDLYFLLTPELYYNYVNYLAANTLSGGGLSEVMVNGVKSVAYMGIPVYIDALSSNVIKNYMEVNPTTALNGATTASDYTAITVDSTAGFPEAGKITIGAGGTGKVFVYTSKTATTFVGESQTMAVNADDSAVTLVAALYNLPNRGLLTSKANMGFYTVSENDFTKIESFYYQVDRANYIAYLFAMDVKILREELISVAY